MKGSFFAIASIAYKEFLHIFRDKRIMILILALPPLLTFIFGHAFETTELTHVPTLLEDRDQSPLSQKFAQFIASKETFDWKLRLTDPSRDPELLREKVDAALIIPVGWGTSLNNGDPAPLRLIADGTDTTTADQINGALQAALGDFQKQQREEMIYNLPEEVIDMGGKLPVEVRKQFESAMTPWSIKEEIVYNPGQRFIDFVIPGIIGLILQLLTVTLMALTIARERESGTLFQLMVTSLQRWEIVVGKVVPYLGISLFLIATSVAVAYFHFEVKFVQPLMLGLICFLFLVCSLGLGLLISAFCTTQTQAIQFAVFYLLPVFPLSGAFAPLEQLPDKIQLISETFPLTHFCHAFRMINLRNADISFIAGDLIFLALGSIITCAGAAVLLKRIQE